MEKVFSDAFLSAHKSNKLAKKGNCIKFVRLFVEWNVIKSCSWKGNTQRGGKCINAVMATGWVKSESAEGRFVLAAFWRLKRLPLSAVR